MYLRRTVQVAREEIREKNYFQETAGTTTTRTTQETELPLLVEEIPRSTLSFLSRQHFAFRSALYYISSSWSCHCTEGRGHQLHIRTTSLPQNKTCAEPTPKHPLPLPNPEKRQTRQMPEKPAPTIVQLKMMFVVGWMLLNLMGFCACSCTNEKTWCSCLTEGEGGTSTYGVWETNRQTSGRRLGCA